MSKSRTLSAETIQQCFKAAIGSSRLKMPPPDDCEIIARRVTKQAALIGTPVAGPILGAAQKHGRLFLRHLPQARAKVEGRYQAEQERGVPARENAHLPGLVELHQAEAAMRALLDRYARKKQRPHDWHDLAGWIAAEAGHVWRPPSGKPRKMVGENDAICLFVQRVLAALGIAKTTHAISATLRGRRARR